jgi:hypothetical protein
MENEKAGVNPEISPGLSADAAYGTTRGTHKAAHDTIVPAPMIMAAENIPNI